MLTSRLVVGCVAGLLAACVVMKLLTPQTHIWQSLSEGILDRLDLESEISPLPDTVESSTKTNRESTQDAVINQPNDVKSVDQVSPRRKFS